MSLASISREKRIFSLQEAKELLPVIQKITESSVDQLNELAIRLESLTEEDAEFHEISETIDFMIRRWSDKIQKLGCEVKGLWLVDFDNGQGYYCWAFPEEDLDHFHGYEEGFAGRTRIC